MAGYYDSIARFFVEDAKKKGAIGIDDILNDSPYVVREGKSYRVEYSKEDGETSLYIYSDGAWDLETPAKSFSGKLIPPHSKRRIAQLIKRGAYPPQAIADVMEWKALQNKR